LKRGLYKSKDGFLINVDVNGWYNIGKNAFPNAFVADGIEGAGLHHKIVVIR
jgi:putative transposase